MLVYSHYVVSASFPRDEMLGPVFHVWVTFISCHLTMQQQHYGIRDIRGQWRTMSLWREVTKSSSAPVIICSGKVSQNHKTRTGNHQHLLWRCKAETTAVWESKAEDCQTLQSSWVQNYNQCRDKTMWLSWCQLRSGKHAVQTLPQGKQSPQVCECWI